MGEWGERSGEFPLAFAGKSMILAARRRVVGTGWDAILGGSRGGIFVGMEDGRTEKGRRDTWVALTG
jgi:hypothetical protein